MGLVILDSSGLDVLTDLYHPMDRRCSAEAARRNLVVEKAGQLIHLIILPDGCYAICQSTRHLVIAVIGIDGRALPLGHSSGQRHEGLLVDPFALGINHGEVFEIELP